MRNLPREWLAGGAAALLAVVLFLTAASAEKRKVAVAARGTYEAAPVPEPRWVPPDFAAIWPPGGDPYKPAMDRRDLPAEDLGIPDFPANAVANPALRPVVDARLQPAKLGVPQAGEIPPDDWLSTARAAGKSTGEPPPAVPEDVFDTVVTANGDVTGTILSEDPDGTLKLKLKNGQSRTFRKTDYTDVRRGMTTAARLQKRSEEIAASTNAMEHEKLGDDCAAAKLWEIAAREYEASVGLSMKESAVAKLAGAYAMMSDPDREIRAYRAILERRQGGREIVFTRLGLLFEALGLPSRAMDAYQGAIKVSPYHVPARVRLASLLAAEGRAAEAETHLTALNADAARKELPEVRLAGGTLAYFSGRYEDARTHLAAAGPAGSHLLGCAEAALGNGAAAVTAFRAAIDANPDSIDSWINLGILCGLAGDWPRAQQCLEEASFRAPVSPHPWAAQGWAWLKQGKGAEATAAFDEALKRDPRNATALFGAGKLALDSGDAAMAEQKLLAALKAGAGGMAYRELGLARMRLKNTSGAVAALRRAVEVSDDPDAHALLGFALLSTDLPAAEQEFRRAIEVDQAHLLGLCGLAAVHYNRRELSEARNRFESVIARVADHPFALRGRKLANEASTRWLWDDEFERKDNESLLRGWVEREKEGLRVRLARGKATLAGKQNRDDGQTGMVRPTSEKFLAFEAELDFTKAGRATAGLFFGGSAGQNTPNPNVLRFCRLSNGKLGWFYGQFLQTPVWKELGEAPGLVVRLRVERGPTGNNWVLSANGTAFPPVNVDVRSPKMEVGVVGMALKDETWELTVDNVRLIEAK